MLMLDNLIRLYYLNHGSFDGIEKSNFLRNHHYEENELYEVLGYQSPNSELTAKEVYEGRKDFVINSYNPSYKKSLMRKLNAKNNSELVDILMSKGFLGVERKHISTLGEFKNCGVPSKFINQKISYALTLLEFKLNSMTYNGNSLLSYRSEILLCSPSEVLGTINRFNINLDDLFLVRFHEQNSAFISDNVLYISPIEGFSEEEVRSILFNCYLLGLPKVPLYLKKIFLESVPGGISLFNLDSVHNLIDISNICKCSVKELLNSFGFNLPDPEEMFSTCFGYYSYSSGKVWYSNARSNSFYDFTLEEFVEMISNNSIQSFDIDLSLALRDVQAYTDSGSLSDSNIF